MFTRTFVKIDVQAHNFVLLAPYEAILHGQVIQGGAYKSANVSMRKTLGLYASLRPCVVYHPLADTQHPTMHVVIAHYAFEYARSHNRRNPNAST